MLRRLIAICLIIAVISSSYSLLFVYAGFALNKQYVADNLCINKSRPLLHCNGKCYFMKKVKQAQESEKKQESRDNLNRLDVSYFQEPFRLTLVEPAITDLSLPSSFSYSYQYSNSYLTAIFRPPKQTA